MDSNIVVRTMAENGNNLPLVIETSDRRVELADWIKENRQELEGHLLIHGGILFRGFRVNGSAHFERVVQEGFDSPLLDYENRSTPRTQVRNKIYTSTEYPADQTIPMHNENSYTRAWAKKIFFYCVLPGEKGGATPIADSRRVYQRIPKDIRDRFEAHGVKYIRNYNGLDLSWQEVFQTDNKEEMETYCRNADIEFEWVSDQHLRTWQQCQASIQHPETGEHVWFNQAQLFHVSSLSDDIRQSLMATLDEKDFPRNAYFGDGSPIPDEDLRVIRKIYEEESVAFPWQSGDILLLDNMLAAHGRKPYEGKRKILVGMIEPYQY